MNTKNKILSVFVLSILAICGIYFLSTNENIPKNTTVSDIKNEISPSENSIVGTWVHDLADPKDPECKNAGPDDVCFPNDSYELDFNRDHSFNSFLHDRPEVIDNIWKIEEGNIIIVDKNNSELSSTYKIISILPDRLELDIGTFRRFK
jgi:hypothetical protein